MAGMATILLSGSWTLIFLVLAMWSIILGIPITLIIWLIKRLKTR